MISVLLAVRFIFMFVIAACSDTELIAFAFSDANDVDRNIALEFILVFVGCFNCLNVTGSFVVSAGCWCRCSGVADAEIFLKLP